MSIVPCLQMERATNERYPTFTFLGGRYVRERPARWAWGRLRARCPASRCGSGSARKSAWSQLCGLALADLIDPQLGVKERKLFPLPWPAFPACV